MIKVVEGIDDEFPYKRVLRNNTGIINDVPFVSCLVCKQNFFNFDDNPVCRDCQSPYKEIKNPSSGVA